MAFVDEAAEGVVTEGAIEGVEDAIEEGLTLGETGEAASEPVEEPDLYTVRVNGREEKVSLDDALNGWMRQQDYTRKTQEVAQQKQELAEMYALQDALGRDPRTTIAILASSLGVDLGPGAQGQAQTAQGEVDPFELLASKVDGLANTLTAQQQAALQAQQQAQQQAMLTRQIEQETADLKQTHGDFNEKELWTYAASHGVVDLAVAYNAWQFEQDQHRKIAETNRATEAKRKAQVVSGGHTASSGAVVPGSQANGRMSLREAFQAAVAASK